MEGISKEDYLKALDIVLEYHKAIEQLAAPIESGKTLFKDWDKLNECSIRLERVLWSGELVYWDSYKKQEKIIYIEDITERSIMKCRGLGRKAWNEFKQIRGY